MQESDIFFFTSIFEATSTVILEAIQNGLPIVCFDRCGFGPIVDDSIGMKIPCKSPKQAVRDFVKAITYLYNHREVLPQMSANSKSKRLELSWDNKMTRLMSFYRKLV
jgi:glycosyltransferase involved in cell wall biosynthesis